MVLVELTISVILHSGLWAVTMRCLRLRESIDEKAGQTGSFGGERPAHAI